MNQIHLEEDSRGLSPTVEAWVPCPACPPDDNIWPGSSFTVWASVSQVRSRPKRPICNACMFDRYPRVYRPCATCGGRMFFNSKKKQSSYPQCPRCRKQDLLVCSRCKEPIEGRAQVQGRCIGCHLLASSNAA